MRLLRIVYNLLFPLVLLAMLPGILLRMVRRGNYRHKFGQRFGIYSKRVRAKLEEGGRWNWVHAVSVGEVLIALKLIAELRERLPDARFVLSTTTSTGYRLAHRRRCEWFEPIYHPLDLPWCVASAFRTIRPERLILVEAEVWPNAMAAAAGIPKALVNARLSPRSERRYRAVRLLAAPLFNSLDAICLQEPADEPRWRGLGVEARRLRLTGSIKFDTAGESASPPRDFWPALEALGVGRNQPILVAGSTFDGEEMLLAGTAAALGRAFPGLFLVLAPRHAERGRAVRDRLGAAGFGAVLRSEGGGPGARILIVNTTGELKDWYRCATAVFIGKSMATAATGGQNPAEAIVAGKPVVFGPHMENFASLARQLVAAGGALQVASPQELEAALAGLLADPARRQAMAGAAAACLDVHRGATARTAACILGLG